MLEGEISEINLVVRLVELWREQFTGAIRFESDGIIKIIYFKGGDILSASTNDRADSVDEILMRAGKVSREHVKQALAKRKENETLGDALLNLGFITRKELTWARRVQVVGVIRSIAAWTSGSFTIVADYLPKRDEGTLFPVPQVIVELIVTDQERQKFERAMDGGRAVFAKASDFDGVFRRLGLNEEAEAIVKQIDGTKSVAEVATASGGESFNVYKLMEALSTLGILTRVDPPAAEQPQFELHDFASAGVADAADVWSESQPQPTPSFELDEEPEQPQPTLEIEHPPAPASAWDEEDQVAAAPAAPERMPAWDVSPKVAAPAPIPVPVEPAAEADEEQWGFDEAQIETARRARAARPVSPRPVITAPKRRSRSGLLYVALAVVVLLAGGYGAFQWWQKRSAEPQPAVVSRVPVARVRPPSPASTTTEVATATVAPAAAQTTPASEGPAVSASESGALPKVTPKPAPVVSAPVRNGDVRATYDAMARQFAANPAGQFTVQIQILCEPSNLAKALSVGGSNVWFVPQPIGSRSCYRVLWGHYETREEAQRAMSSIPAGVRDRSASVKPIPRG